MSGNWRRHKRWLGAGFTVATLVVSIGVVSLVSQPAHAGPGCPSGPNIDSGRSAFCGYFDNNFDDGVAPAGQNVLSGTPAIPWTITGTNPNVAQAFINFISNYLQTGSVRDKVGADFIVQTMLGFNGGTHPRADSNVGTADYNTWVKLIKQYDAANLIDWDHKTFFTCGMEDSYYQTLQHDDAYFHDFSTADGCGGLVDSIVFWNQGHTKILYTLKRACANPLGAENPLTPLNYSLKTTLVSGAGTPAYTTGPNTGIISPGNVYHLTPSVINPSNIDSNPLVMEVQNLKPLYMSSAGIAAPGGYDTSDNYRIGTCTSGVAQCWNWTYGNGIPANRSSVETNGVAFQVSAATPQGTKVCFRVTIAPSTQAAGSRLTVPAPPDSYCFLVYSPVYPSVVGQNGDVHAGGGICNLTSSGGSVQGFAGGASGGQYVVSATGGINNFSTDGGNGTALALGQNGGYAQVCRPDLLGGTGGAQAYYNAGIGGCVGGVGNFCTVGGTDFDVTGKSGVYFFTPGGGSTVTVHGVVSNKVTLVALHGNVKISGAVTIGGGVFAAHNAPSFGIIAKGNITIPAAVTRVDAYLFADGTIDTCSDFATPGACATPQLVVNGFLMGQTIAFHREGPAGAAAGSTISEKIVLNPQIYLNPPKFFDNSVDDVLLEGQGEKQPLF